MKEIFLTRLRDRKTAIHQFRSAAQGLIGLLLDEAADLISPLKPSAERIVLVPILRAGLAFLDPALKMFPSAPVGILGMRRDERTAIPHLYYQNLPALTQNDWIFILDPMLATGGSSRLALELVQKAGASLSKTVLISIIAAREGTEAIRRHFPETRQVFGAIDPDLDGRKFIVPGLGDFGDRYFGT